MDSCKKLLVVVSKLMGPSVQITAHIITLNGVTVQIVEVHWEVISKNWPPLSTSMEWRIEYRNFSSNWQQYSYTIMALKVYTSGKQSSLFANSDILSLYCSLRQHSSVQFCCCMFLFLFCLHILKCWVVLGIDTYFYTFTFPNDTSIYNLLA